LPSSKQVPARLRKVIQNSMLLRVPNGWVAALTLSLCTCTGWAQSPQTWVVSVGVDDYVKESVPDLEYAGADAKLIAQSLQDLAKVPAQNIFTFTSDAVQPDLSPRATNIMFRLNWIKEQCKPGDTLVFFFAGHGMQLDQQGYLLTEEADNKNPETLKGSSLRSDDLLRQLVQMPTSKILFIFDACRNEAGASKGLGDSISRSFTFSRANLEYATIFSCNVGERSWEWQDKRHGFFTFHLAEGLQAGAVEPTGQVSLQSLTRHLRDSVPISVKTYAKADQNPIVRYEGPGTDNWILARLAPPPKTAPAEGEQARLVAQLDATRAQLEKVQAEKKVLQDRLLLQETESKQMLARLEILERQSSSLPDPATEVAARDLANQNLQKIQQNKPTEGSNLALLEAEKQELKAQNDALQARIKVLELKLGKELVASREAVIAADPEVLKFKAQEVAASDAQVRLSAQVQRLQREQRLFLQDVPALASALSTKLPNPAPDPRVAFLSAQIQIYVKSGEALQKQLETTQKSLKSLQNQKEQAEARLRLAEAALQKTQAELEQQRKEVARLEEANQKLKLELVQERQMNEVALTRLKELEDATRQKFKGVAIDSQWSRITRRTKLSDITFAEPKVGDEAESLGPKKNP